MWTHRRAPVRDSHGIDDPLRIPFAEFSQFILKTDGWGEMFLEMLDDLFGVEIRGEIARGVISWMRIGHVPRQHATQSRRFHRFESHRLSQQTDLRMKTEIN